MDWNEAALAKLRKLWAEGLSTAQIGEQMGVSKNAIVGKAHRMGLQARPSPIIRGPERQPRRTTRLRSEAERAAVLPHLTSVSAALPPPCCRSCHAGAHA